MNIEPIGYFHGDADYKFEVPRQGAFHAGHIGVIVLLPGKNFELALRDIGGFERLWILFLFHKKEATQRMKATSWQEAIIESRSCATESLW